MRRLRQLWFHLRPLFGCRRVNAELSEEIQAHLELAVATHIARGKSPAEARAAAEREFGRLEQIADQYRDARGVNEVFGLGLDLRHAMRTVVRAKAFTAVSVVTLALGIGSAVAIFSVIDWAVFRSAEFPDGLVIVGAASPQGDVNYGRLDFEIEAYRESAPVFSQYGLARRHPVNIAVEGQPVANGVTLVSANLLPMFELFPRHGRGFLAGEETAGANQVAIVTQEFAREYFGDASRAVGRILQVGQTTCNIVGVLAPRPLLPTQLQAAVFCPLDRERTRRQTGDHYLMFGQLGHGISREQAEAALAAVNVALPERVQRYRPWTRLHLATVAELRQLLRPEIHWVLVGAVGFLYAIACLNTANLMLVRLLGRRRELSIRMALGGGRWRVMRLLFIESAGLTCAASAGGVLVANWLAPTLMAVLLPQERFHWARWALDGRAISVLLSLSALTGLLVAVLPALRFLREDIRSGLKDGGTTLGEERSMSRLRDGIVVLQAALAVVLLSGGGLMVRTLTNLQRVPLGFDEANLIKVQVSLPGGLDGSYDQRLMAFNSIRDRVRAVPAVDNVAFGTDSLFRGDYDPGVTVVGPDGIPTDTELGFVSKDFVATAGLTLLRGRPPRQSEVMINASFAKAMFGEQDPIGRIIRPIRGGESEVGWQIVGIVADVRDNARTAPGNHLYGPEGWYPPALNTLLVRTFDPATHATVRAIKRAIYDFHPGIVVGSAMPFADVRSAQARNESFVLGVLKVLSIIALALTLAGLFATIAYTVSRRMGEFGVRLAFGATPRDLVALVFGRGLRLTGAGLAIGVACALGLSRFLRSLLFETAPYDPFVLGIVTIVLLIVASMACTLPALHARRADIAQLLRTE